MNAHGSCAVLAALTITGWLLVGCGPKDDHDHGHAHGEPSGGEHGHEQEHEHEHEHQHEQAEASPSGASFVAGRGVLVTDESKRRLGLEVTDVAQRLVPNQIPFTVQVYGEKHRHLPNQNDHSGCDVHGSGFVSTNTGAMVRAGQPVEVGSTTNAPLGGVVLAVQKAIALGESEIVVGVSNAASALRPGEFVPVRILLPRASPVSAIPQSALLRTAEGAFVYVLNGDAYRRTAVSVGAEADGWVEIADGLRSGDRVVSKPVQALWLIELRATKGGGHSH